MKNLTINVGDYVRTNNGDIGIIINCPEELKKDYGNWLWFETTDEQRPIRNEDIKLTSPNIIDLISRYDLVNRHLVICKMYEDEKDIPTIIKCVGDYYFKEEDIKSIVTKEQFESMEYKI